MKSGRQHFRGNRDAAVQGCRSVIGWTLAALIVASVFGSTCKAGESASPPNLRPLKIDRLNLIFVPSPDVNPATGLMTPRGLQRSLRLARRMTGIMTSVGDIHAVAPTTAPLRGRNAYDLSALEGVEQLALEFDAPIDASDAAQCGLPCPSRGLDAADLGNPNGPNEKLVEGIIAGALRYRSTGNHVFSMPAALLNNLIAYINAAEKYKLVIPRLEPDEHDTIYVISIDSNNRAALRIYRFSVNPPPRFPKVRLPRANTCPQPHVKISTEAMGLKPPAGINTNETVYLVRHVEAHPNNQFENGNYVCRGEWRALGSPLILYRKITASSGGRLPRDFQVYGPDPSYPAGPYRNSYIRAALTVYPFAIAYGLPMRLAKGIPWDERRSGENAAIRFFFMRPASGNSRAGFSNATLLIGWEHENIGRMMRDLLDTYYHPAKAENSAQLPRWDSNDYDSIWKVSLDANGNLTFSNDCEGVPSAALEISCPAF